MRAGDETPFGYLRDPTFLFCFALYFLNRWVLKTGPWGHVAFFHWYLNDLICIPFWLPPLLLAYRKLGVRCHDGPPDYWEIMIHLCIWSVLFEAVAPHLELFRGKSIADPRDILCYSIGAAVAGVTWRLAPARPRHPSVHRSP